MHKSYKFRIYLSNNQERELAIMLESHRRLYNQCLDERIFCWETYKASLNYYFQCHRFKILRQSNEYYARLNFSSAQGTMRRLDKAFQTFFRRVKSGDAPGFPRFKSPDHFNSITFPIHGDGIRLKGNRLRIQHVGFVRVKVHREVEGKIKTLTLKRENSKWFLILSCDLGEVAKPENKGTPIGIDLGLTHFLTTSEGEKVENPRLLKASLKKLRVVQRALSRKKRGSNNRKKTKSRLRNLHYKISNKRRDFHHKVSHRLVNSHSLIAVERLNVQGMLKKSHRLSRAIADVGWSQFAAILSSKAESAGSQVQFVDPKNTSQECSRCGRMVEKDLFVRVHDCPCGLILCRDWNAAINVLARTGPGGVKEEDALLCPGSPQF